MYCSVKYPTMNIHCMPVTSCDDLPDCIIIACRRLHISWPLVMLAVLKDSSFTAATKSLGHTTLVRSDQTSIWAPRFRG